MSKLLRVGITHGDINGIGYELILKTLADPEILELCTPIVFGSQQVVAATEKALRLQSVAFNVISKAHAAIDGRANLVNVCAEEPALEWGKQTEAAIRAEADSLTAALEAYRNNEIDVLLTAPGHLDNDLESHALCDFVRQALGSETPAFDWVINGSLRTLVLHPSDCTTELGEGIAQEELKGDLRHIHNDLRKDFGFIRPRMAVLASETRSRSELKELQEEGITVFGSFEADTFISQGNHLHYDALLFIHSEEARHRLLDLLPSEATYGFAAGLPLVLTYPLLPVSYDIAGKGVADPTPLRYALYAAIDIYRTRRRFLHATRKPLEKQWVPRGRDDFKLDLTKEEVVD